MPAAAFSDATRKLFLAAQAWSASEVSVRNAPSAGANLGARDEDGATPFGYARRHNGALRGTDAYWRLDEARFK